MKKALLYFLLPTLLSGCMKYMEDFVRNGPSRSPKNPDATSPDNFGSQIGYKLSPGANIAAGSQVRSQFAITPTDRTVEGAQIKSKFSMRFNRTQ